MIVIFFIALLPLFSLFTPGVPISHDGLDHVVRIASFYESLTQGNIVPRWAGNLNWGYGHPIFMFLYPFPSYVGSFFHSLGFTLVDSTKLVFAVAYVTSMLAMFAWIRALWGTKAGVMAAVLYGFAPYRFVDLYVRGAIGEHMAFVFPPIICLGLYALAKGKKFGIILFVVGMSLLILSHNAVSLMFLPIIMVYGVYCYFFEAMNKTRFIVFAFVGLGFGFLLSAFFWIPAFFEGKYTLRDIVTQGDFKTRFVSLTWFFYSPWNYGGGNEFSKSVGFTQIAVLIGALFTKQKNNYFLIGLYGIFVFSIFLMTNYSAYVWEHISLLQKFQFPWRFLTVIVFVSAVVGGSFISKIKNVYVFYSLVFLAIVSTVGMWHPVRYESVDVRRFVTNYPGTTDTGESSPIWSIRFMESYPKADLEVVDGTAIVMTEVRTHTDHVYTVENSEPTIFVENTLYFPGWRVFVDEREIIPQYQNPDYRGRMMIEVPEGAHKIRVLFTDTKLRKIANSISVGGLILGTIYLWYLYLLPLPHTTKKKI